MALWGGRFEKGVDAFTQEFGASLEVDKAMAQQDIAGSRAHAKMLAEQGIISEADQQAIDAGLADISGQIANGDFAWDVNDEDIHMAVEGALTRNIGTPGARLHTGRSRNDQVALDVRMYAREACAHVNDLLKSLLDVLLSLSRRHLDTIMPGYTHLQKAQPITLAFHLMAYAQMFMRDINRFEHAYAEADVMPLGSGALAGTTYPLNRERVRELLGFSEVTDNALDGVSDRDFLLSFLSAASICMMHLSRFCEELILWNSSEFHFVEMDDAFSTGSSIMPQKKNPDVCELIRGKTGRVYGDLMTLLTTMKALPLAYNKDMQEDKECVFDAIDTVKQCLQVFAPMFRTMTLRKKNMRKAASQGFINATDCADYLTKKGVPFRDAYMIVGRLVNTCIHADETLETMTLKDFKSISNYFDADVYEALDLKTCVEGRSVTGGPAPKEVTRQIKKVESFLKDAEEQLEDMRAELRT